MKKKLTIAIVMLALAAFILNLWLDTAFEGPVIADMTGRIALFPEERRIELPWYLAMCSQEDVCFDGTDPDGNAYSWFCYMYSIHSFLSYAELNCIVNWDDQTAMMYLGESKAMEVIDLDFPDVQWK